jgi:elongation factor Tu
MFSLFNIFKANKDIQNQGSQPIQPSTNNINKSAMDNEDLYMVIEDIFTITGRGTVVTGTVTRGSITLHDNITITTVSGPKPAVIMGIEMFRKKIDRASAGDRVGLLIKEMAPAELHRGDVIYKH